MAPRDRIHILVTRPAIADAYTSYQTGRGSARPPSPLDRVGHSAVLRAAALAAERQAIADRAMATQQLGVVPGEGTYLQFESWPGFELKLSTLSPATGTHRPELVAVQHVVVDDQTVEVATVFVPDGGLGHFLDRFDQYASEDTVYGHPRHADFVERIARVQLATLAALWTDPPESFPAPDETVWWEVWLRRADGGELARLRSVAERADFVVDGRHLVFDNRTITLVHASATQLGQAFDVLDDFAELRLARTTSALFSQAPAVDQSEWIADLVRRTTTAPLEGPSVCVLDTGLHREHALLVDSIGTSDRHSCDPAWGVTDHDGHGTAMAGLALYGDLRRAIEGGHLVDLRHRLESVKILPPTGENDPELYGALVAEAVSRVEIAEPDRRRAFSMAVTAGGDYGPGTPTSWSAAIDALAAGQVLVGDDELRFDDAEGAEPHRLFVLSAGNVACAETAYLARCDVSAVEEPAQAWNALTVGAHTELVDVAASGSDWAGWSPVAPAGDLSPVSRTSVVFDRNWAVKPDVVAEGGNVAVSSAGSDFDTPPSLQLLTTSSQTVGRMLTTTNATSAATAQVAELAASLMAEYPAYWPETIRALIVHSARWTTRMQERGRQAGESKGEREKVFRRYGRGVPDRAIAMRSATDALTMVVQDVIHPYKAGLLREMHTHALPWPTDALDDLGDQQVLLRATLSYFVEPNPTRRWSRRYRYASHLLRFELKHSLETDEDFRKRLNKRALDEEEERPPLPGDDTGWFLGSNGRNRGSLHTDTWHGPADELARRGRIAVYPIGGWWKEQRRRDRSELGARYALILSIDTPADAADVWTPVAQQVGIPIPTEIVT